MTLTDGILASDGLFVEQASSSPSSTDQFWLVDGYVSGTLLTGSMTFLSTSLASAGFNIGSYTWTWESQGISDSLTMNVGEVSVMPAPAAIALLGLGLTGMGFSRKKLKS